MFMAWIGEEAGAPLADIDQVATQIDRGDAALIVPVTAYSEVIEAKSTPEQMAKFRAFLKRSNVEVANTTQAIAEKAGDIRSRGIMADPKRSIKVPDATFLATAIIYRATVFHTLEKGMLPGLSGTDIVDGLLICPPRLWGGPSSLLGFAAPS